MPRCAAELISFSGIDGAGKSTQIALLTAILAGRGQRPKYLWTRGGYTGPFNSLKAVLRAVLGKGALPSGRTHARTKAFGKKWVQNVWLILAMVDLVLVYGIYLRLLKLSGRTVIADRYLADTWIDFTLNFPNAGFDRWPLWRLLELVTPRPDHAFLLLIPVEESLRRSLIKNEPYPDSKEVLCQRLEHYQRFAVEPNWHVMDCTDSVDSVSEQIASKIGCMSKG